MTTTCEYFQVCQLEVSRDDPAQKHCILHLKQPNKDGREFRKEVLALVDRGCSDFRNVCFPPDYSFAEVCFPGFADFNGVTFGALHLRLKR